MFDETIAAAAAEALEAARKRSVMIVTAESCTGGLVAAALTSLAGSSDAMEGGFVTYSNAAKIRLGVSASDIATHGAVSRPVAEALARAAVRTANDPLAAVSVTGIAGPGGGSPDKPVGLVHFAAVVADGAAHHAVHTFGPVGRTSVRTASVRVALNLLTEALRADGN